MALILYVATTQKNQLKAETCKCQVQHNFPFEIHNFLKIFELDVDEKSAYMCSGYHDNFKYFIIMIAFKHRIFYIQENDYFQKKL